jgi:hypothetical protein
MADVIPIDTFRTTYLFLFEEITGDSPKDDRGNAVLDTDTGWTQSLAAVDAEQASQPIAPGGTTIASQAAHAAYYIELLEALARGERPETDWPGSFSPRTVDAEAWERTKQRLSAALGRFRAMVEASELPPEHLQGALGVLLHTAYHLGAVRQMLRVVGALLPKQSA